MKDISKKYIRKSVKSIKRIVYHKYKPVKVLSEVSFIKGIFSSEEVVPLKNLHNSNVNQIFQISTGRIDTDNCYSDCFITKNRELIHDISFSYAEGKHIHALKNNIFDRFQNSRKPITIHGNIFSLLSGGGPQNNYYHWLFDSLSRLKILQGSNYNKNIDFYYVPNYSKFKKESLLCLGIQEEQIIDSKKISNLIANSVIATNHPNRLPVPYWICEFLRSSFLHDGNTNLINSRRIYISRNKAKNRRILNEKLLFEKLSKLGFELLYLEELSFREQVNFFSESNTIISPHGAGLANLVFCKPGTKIIEIFPPNSYSNIFENISRNVGLNYFSCEGSGIDKINNMPNLHSDFNVNYSQILKRAEI